MSVQEKTENEDIKKIQLSPNKNEKRRRLCLQIQRSKENFEKEDDLFKIQKFKNSLRCGLNANICLYCAI